MNRVNGVPHNGKCTISLFTHPLIYYINPMNTSIITLCFYGGRVNSEKCGSITIILLGIHNFLLNFAGIDETK